MNPEAQRNEGTSGSLEREPADRETGREQASNSTQRSGRLTDRDRELIATLATVRYLSTDQIRRLFFPGRRANVAGQRLLSLAGAGRRAMTPALLRKLVYRDHEQGSVAVWALTAVGYVRAEMVLGNPVRVPTADVGQAFLEHTVVLNELYVGLAEAALVTRLRKLAPDLARARRITRARLLDRVYASSRAAGFRWTAEDGAGLPWKEYDPKRHEKRARRIQPDAILELPDEPRRLFLECEMGTHSIVAVAGDKPGSTLAKLDRYHAFMSRYADAEGRITYYKRAFPDGWPAQVWFLAHSEHRAASVTDAIATWAKDHHLSWLTARALTLDSALGELAPALGLESGGALALAVGGPPPSAPGAKQVTMSADDVGAMRAFYESTIRAYKIARDRARAEGKEPPEYPLQSQHLYKLLFERPA